MLGSTAQKEEPAKVEGIAVGRTAQKLHFLHANGYGGGPNKEGSDWFVKDGTTIGEYTVRYEDKSTVSIPIVYGDHTRDWFYPRTRRSRRRRRSRGPGRTRSPKASGPRSAST